MNGAAQTTDTYGEVTVRLNMGQDTKWVGISKGGFISQQVDVPAKWLLKVVPQPTTRPSPYGRLPGKRGMIGEDWAGEGSEWDEYSTRSAY